MRLMILDMEEYALLAMYYSNNKRQTIWNIQSALEAAENLNPELQKQMNGLIRKLWHMSEEEFRMLAKAVEETVILE